MATYALPVEVQEFLSQVPSRVFTNIVWNLPFDTSDNEIPSNPNGTRRSLIYDKAIFSADATPNPDEYNVFIKNLDNSTDLQVTFSRGF